MKSLGVKEYPEEVSPEEFASFDAIVAATEPMLSDESILAMVREVEEPIEVTLLNLSFLIESDKLQRCTMDISKLIEKEISQTSVYKRLFCITTMF